VAFIIAAPPVLARLFRRLLGSLLLCLCLLLFLLPLPLLVELLLKVGKLQRIVENPLPLTRNRVYGLGFRVGKLQRIVENPLPLTRNRAWISHWPRMAAAGLYYTGLLPRMAAAGLYYTGLLPRMAAAGLYCTGWAAQGLVPLTQNGT
jgi:hypothetical protein